MPPRLNVVSTYDLIIIHHICRKVKGFLKKKQNLAYRPIYGVFLVCGLVIFILANFGYGLFAKSAKNSIAGLIASIVSMLIVIFAAEYFCLSYEIFQAYKELDITFFEAVRATPDFLAEPEVQSAVIEELVIAYALGILASVGNIINIVKARKAAAQEENQVVE